jgi:hypothetical protein
MPVTIITKAPTVEGSSQKQRFQWNGYVKAAEARASRASRASQQRRDAAEFVIV